MRVDHAGTPQAFATLSPGTFFLCQLQIGPAMGLRIAATEPRKYLILAGGDPKRPAPHISAVNLETVYVLKEARLVLPARPSELRATRNPKPGQIVATETAHFLCAEDIQANDYDPVLINLTSGAMIERTGSSEPTALFDTWDMAVHRGQIDETIMGYPPKP